SHWGRRRESGQVDRVRCNQVERGPSRHFPRAERKRSGVESRPAGSRHLELGRSCQSDIVVIVLANPVNHCADIETLHPRVRRPVVVQSEIGSIPWEGVPKDKQTRETKSFRVSQSLKLDPGEPGAVDSGCQPPPVSVAKNRRLQNIGRFVVETFQNGASKVEVRIDYQGNWTNHAWNAAGRTKYQRPVLHSRWRRR